MQILVVKRAVALSDAGYSTAEFEGANKTFHWGHGQEGGLSSEHRENLWCHVLRIHDLNIQTLGPDSSGKWGPSCPHELGTCFLSHKVTGPSRRESEGADRNYCQVQDMTSSWLSLPLHYAFRLLIFLISSSCPLIDQSSCPSRLHGVTTHKNRIWTLAPNVTWIMLFNCGSLVARIGTAEFK